MDVSLRDNLNVTPLERAIEAHSYRTVEAIVRRSKRSILDGLLSPDDETLLTRSLRDDDQHVSIALINGIIIIFNYLGLYNYWLIELIEPKAANIVNKMLSKNHPIIM